MATGTTAAQVAHKHKGHIWGPWGSQAWKTPGWGGGPKPRIPLAWGPGQGPQNRNTKHPRKTYSTIFEACPMSTTEVNLDFGTNAKKGKHEIQSVGMWTAID